MFVQRVVRRCALRQRAYSTPSKPRSGHADFYASLLPAMIPVALLGSAVYMVSPLWQFFILSTLRWHRCTARENPSPSALNGRFTSSNRVSTSPNPASHTKSSSTRQETVFVRSNRKWMHFKLNAPPKEALGGPSSHHVSFSMVYIISSNDKRDRVSATTEPEPFAFIPRSKVPC